jgi:tetratricopeptide (TPR) repeat protein/serine/threonine protein kinase
MTTPNLDEEAIFLVARRIEAVESRRLYLQQACGADQHLQERLDALLRVHDQPDGFLGLPPEGIGPPADDSISERPGSLIGPYKLLEQIGEGGMGLVYMAEQQQPVRRYVALKIIKPGMDSRQVVARFEAERQALAMMDHVNIAKVLDAGATHAGLPYFVMELVKGVPITKYCDENHFTLQQRLNLFVTVCQAVQHAHQKGIIHRDIKPTNILVALYDDMPVPKVIDFGVAKATAQKLTEKTMYTGYGQLIGTLEYMSPEQAQFNQLDIDTRSDIYSLGVLLYELLTGSTPLEQARLRTIAFDETLRIIREEVPPKPSTRLSTAGALGTIAANRNIEPAQLRRQVKGDLDWIVMKALEKNRSRRYESASGLAADVQRFLRDDPVQACPPSMPYRLKKFVRRNRAGVLAAGLALVVVLLLLGAGTRIGRERARRQTNLNQQMTTALQEAVVFRQQALNLIDAPHQWEATLAMASSALKRAQTLDAADARLLDPAVQSQVNDLAAQLATDDRDRRLVSDIDRIRLEKSEPDIEQSRFMEQEAAPKYRQAFASFGITAQATPAAEAATWIMSKHPPLRAALMAGLYDWLDHQSDRQEQAWLYAVLAAADLDDWRSRWRAAARSADVAALEALAVHPDAPAQPPATLVILANGLTKLKSHDAAAALLRRAQQRYPADFWINHWLARALHVQQPSQPAESLTYYRISVALRPQSAGAYMNLGAKLRNAGDLPGAFAAYETATELEPRYAGAHCGLGDCLWSKGDWPAAIAAYQQAIELQPQLAKAHHGLGLCLKATGDLPGAAAALRSTIAIQPDVASTYYNLGVVLRAQGDRQAAMASYQKAIELQPNYASAHLNLGTLLSEQGDQSAALAALQKAIEHEPQSARAHHALGVVLHAKGDLLAALAAYEKALAIDPDLATAHYGLGRLHVAKGDVPAAVAAYQKAIALRPNLAEAHVNLSILLKAQGDLAGAIAALRRAIEIKPDLAEAHWNLGRALRDQGAYREALTALRRAHELGSKRANWTLPSARLIEEVQRLVELDAEAGAAKNRP